MSIFEILIITCLVVNYGKLILNLIKGGYTNNIKNLFIDLIVSYYLAPLLTIAIIWDWYDKRTVIS